MRGRGCLCAPSIDRHEMSRSSVSAILMLLHTGTRHVGHFYLLQLVQMKLEGKHAAETFLPIIVKASAGFRNIRTPKHRPFSSRPLHQDEIFLPFFSLQK